MDPSAHASTVLHTQPKLLETMATADDLWYAEHTEEAARFYASIFPDSRVDYVTSLMSESPSVPAGSVKLVDSTFFGQRFQAITAARAYRG